MIRFTARFLGIWFLAAGMVTAIVDGAKSIAASGIVVTPISDLAALQTSDAVPDWSMKWLPMIDGLMRMTPLTAVFAALGILLLIAGRRRRIAMLSRQFAA